MAAAEEPEEKEAPKPKAKLELQTIIVLANGIFLLAGLGFMVFTKLMLKKPEIVESVELKKKQDEAKKPLEVVEKPIVIFDQMIINIAMTSGKAHYATIAFSIETRDPTALDLIQKRKPMFTDMMISTLGKKQLTELNTIQGKLLFKTQMIKDYNKVLTQAGSKLGGVMDMYFSTFILQ